MTGSLRDHIGRGYRVCGGVRSDFRLQVRQLAADFGPPLLNRMEVHVVLPYGDVVHRTF